MTFVERLVSYWAFGFASILLSAVTYGFYHVITKNLTINELDSGEEPLPAVYIVLFRQLLILLTSIPAAAYYRTPVIRGFRWKQWLLLISRSLAAIIASVAAQLAIKRLVLSDFMTILATVPILATLISWPIFKEAPRYTDAPIYVSCFAGVIFIVQPGFLFASSENYLPPDFVGILLAFLVVAFNISIAVIMRGIREIPVSSIHVIYGATSVAVVLGANLIFTTRLAPCSLIVRTQLIAVGLMASISLALDSLASKILPPGFTTLPPVVEIVFHIIWQSATTHKAPPLFSLVGACLVMVAFSYFAIRAWLLHSIHKKHQNQLWYRLLTS